jgi:hypothetical protein
MPGGVAGAPPVMEAPYADGLIKRPWTLVLCEVSGGAIPITALDIAQIDFSTSSIMSAYL